MHVTLLNITLAIALALSASATAPESVEPLLPRRSLPADAFINHWHQLQRRTPVVDSTPIDYKSVAAFWGNKGQTKADASPPTGVKRSASVKETKSQPTVQEVSKSKAVKRPSNTGTTTRRPAFQSFVNPKKMGL
ncbi:hypothetical protein H4R35_000122 [Dimargaris xerosporica]|nr:hypothetical protein H4R35_000122 [Dimargaris xerosporica]